MLNSLSGKDPGLKNLILANLRFFFYLFIFCWLQLVLGLLTTTQASLLSKAYVKGYVKHSWTE